MRLIDTDLLLKSIEVAPQFDCVGEILKRYIECFPTAYDVGKVIECFEKERNFLFDENGRCYSAREKITIDKAIEIVKSGGVADE